MLLLSTLLCSCQVQTGKDPAQTDPVTDPVTEPPVTEPELPYPSEEAADVFEYILNRYEYLEFGDGTTAGETSQKAILATINQNCKNWMNAVDRNCTTDPFGKNLKFTSANMSAIHTYILHDKS